MGYNFSPTTANHPKTVDHRVIKQVFLEGPPRFDVGLSPIALSDWLLPDDQAHWLADKNKLIDQAPEQIFAALDRSEGAQHEAAQLILALGQGGPNDNEPPLMGASRLVSDDLVIMEGREGAWITTACCLCSPTFFSASHALGKSLEVLHGPVPDGDFGLAARIGRVFTALRPDVILQRHNWTVQWSNARFTPDGTPLREAAAAASIEEGADQLYLRVERQTIRKLPNTGAVLFTIRIRLTRLVDAIATAASREAFAQAWNSAPAPVRGYKKWAVLERHVAHMLKT
jgi:dimethylamine monooxygenase subunit A